MYQSLSQFDWPYLGVSDRSTSSKLNILNTNRLSKTWRKRLKAKLKNDQNNP